jgi:hypothetical protein
VSSFATSCSLGTQVAPRKERLPDEVGRRSPDSSVDPVSSDFPIYKRKVEPEEKKIRGTRTNKPYMKFITWALTYVFHTRVLT